MVQLNNNAVLSSGKYRIEKLLGQGGFGITYKAIMKETVSGSLGNMEVDVPVAIKEFFMKDTCEREEGTGEDNRSFPGKSCLGRVVSQEVC